MTQVTSWLWQFDNAREEIRELTSYEQLPEVLRKLTPAGHEPALMVKTHSGSDWQGEFDRHPLAIVDTEALIKLRLAFDDAKMNLGAWGEARGVPYSAGALAGHCAYHAGYYALDLEPYEDFALPTVAKNGLGAVCEHAIQFWRGYRDGGGLPGAGVSLVAQASGVDPFGRAGLLCWLHGVAWLHLQSYYESAPNLDPRITMPWLQERLDALGLTPQIIHIVEPGKVMDRLSIVPPPAYVDVWRL